MPSIYAHEKFGAMVLENLPDSEKEIIRKYSDEYRIGLQGPDFLFFYHPLFKNKISKMGKYYHRMDCYQFMEQALDVVRTYGTDSPQYSYILGYICHFSLDSSCHPYVAEAMVETGCGHAEIEGDFEQLLLMHDRYVPHKYPSAELVPTGQKIVEAMQPFYVKLSLEEIGRAMEWMKKMKEILFAPGFLKRAGLDMIIYGSFQHKKLKGHMMLPRPNKKCRKQVKRLYRILKKTVPKGVELIDNFSLACEGGMLSEEFHKDFYGRKV